MRINVVHSCGHVVVVRRYTAFIDRSGTKATLESRLCDSCMLARLTQARKLPPVNATK